MTCKQKTEFKHTLNVDPHRVFLAAAHVRPLALVVSLVTLLQTTDLKQGSVVVPHGARHRQAAAHT